MNTERTKNHAKKRLLAALPFWRIGVIDAAKSGTPKIMIAAENPDGSGRMIVRFDCKEFFEDLAIVLDAPELTDDDFAAGKAEAFLTRFGLKHPI